MNRLLAAFLACFAASACSWVALDKGARDVLVLPAERVPEDCESLGTVRVSVLEKVGVLERHDEEVVEDLNILARNHAAQRGADTVVARGPVTDGARQYEVLRCLPGGDARDEEDDKAPADGVEVIPYRRGV